MLDDVFRALADPTRRRLLDSLNAHNGQTLRDLCADLSMTRQSVSKHLAVLEEANLVTTVRRGREKLHHLNAEPVNAIADRWLTRYDRHRVQLFADLKTTLEQTVSEHDFVYTTYVRTTPELLWRALTEPEFTRQYWGVSHETDWRPGSPIAWRMGEVTMAGPGQEVREYDPYRRLSYTWHAITPEFADAVGMSAEDLEAAATEPLSTATFELTPVDDQVKLTVTHSGFRPGSLIRRSVSEGWIQLLSDLKSFAETAPALQPA